MVDNFVFRYIHPNETEEAAAIEAVCFPPNEACSYDHMIARAEAAPERFLTAIDQVNGRMAGFLNGIATDESVFRDEFFTDASTHDPHGNNIMLLGLDVLPEYRLRGLARELVSEYCRREKERGTKRLVLTCHDYLVEMYEKFGFRDLGKSASVWGGVAWHEMELVL